MRSIPIALPCSVFLLAFISPRAARAQLPQYGMAKIERFKQTADGVVNLNSGNPFEFAAQASFEGSLTGPNGSVVQLDIEVVGNFYETVQTFTTQAEMDAAYPSGVYTFAVPSQAPIKSTLSADLYPPTPAVVQGYWSGGSLLVDPAHPFFLSFSSIPGFLTVGAATQVNFNLAPGTGGADVLDSEWDSETDDAAPAGITIPSGTLSAGSFYTLDLQYTVFSTLDSTTVPGSLVAAQFQRRTQISILAQAPPIASPAALLQPQSQTIAIGSTVVFNFLAGGTPAPTYQWYHNGSPLGSGLATLTISGTKSADAGTYYCVAANSVGSVTSSQVTLAISQAQDVGRLVNISCRSLVGTSSNIMIAGFVVGGAGTSGSENLLIRGSGPALAAFSVSGTLPDPQLQIFSGSSLLASNSGWAGSPAIAAAAATVNAFAWTAGASHDSAVLQPLGSGAYTAQISGQAGDTGVSLAEVYDETPAGTYTATSPRLVNISARVQVGTGGNILIAGFVIGGSTSRTVLIRASGPALVPFGVPGTLPDPKLQLYSGSAVLATNSSWQGDQAILGAAEAVKAFAWNDPSSADSAILVTLPPGAYTAQVSGASGDTGVALVEIYEVP